MTVSVLHTADAWWLKTPDGDTKIDTTARRIHAGVPDV
jgi:hypothetical protein